MEYSKQDRLLELFFRGLRGEALSAQKLAEEYGVSKRSVSRDLSDLKAFCADHRELVGHTELEYDYQEKAYRLSMDEVLTNQELFVLVKMLMDTRALDREEAFALVEKLKRLTTRRDRPILDKLLDKELARYHEVKHDCDSLQDTLWKLADVISRRQEITIHYYRSDRTYNERRVQPLSLMFSEYYFYLIAYRDGDETRRPTYYRVDRIKQIIEHRTTFTLRPEEQFDEGLLRERSQFMFPGELRTIRFEYTGPSVQAVLDRLPASRILRQEKGKYLLEAEVYGDGIKMWLYSQGPWVRVVSPASYVEEVRRDLEGMLRQYSENET